MGRVVPNDLARRAVNPQELSPAAGSEHPVNDVFPQVHVVEAPLCLRGQQGKARPDSGGEYACAGACNVSLVARDIDSEPTGNRGLLLEYEPVKPEFAEFIQNRV